MLIAQSRLLKAAMVCPLEDTRAFDRYLRQTAEIAAASSRDDLASAIDVLFEAWRSGAAVFTCGNVGANR